MINNIKKNPKAPYRTDNPEFGFRIATPQDAAFIVKYMNKLGAYQKMAEKITATADKVEHLLKNNLGEAVFGVYNGDTVGFAYFHQKSSAFTGRSGLYIDGFYIDESMRGKGLGEYYDAVFI